MRLRSTPVKCKDCLQVIEGERGRQYATQRCESCAYKRKLKQNQESAKPRKLRQLCVEVRRAVPTTGGETPFRTGLPLAS